MEYLNNLFNSNTQSGGVYAVSMHQLNQILQLSSAYFNRFDDNTKQEYIKLFGFTPLSLLKGHSSSKMPQYRERFIFLIYLQFCVLLMMNNTAGMETKEEVLEYLSKLCKEFKISPDNKICKNINDALSGSTSKSSTVVETPPVVETKQITLDELIGKIFNYKFQKGGEYKKINDFDIEVINKFYKNNLYENFINLIIYNIDDLNEDITKISINKNINDDNKTIQIIKLISNYLSDETGINIYYDDNKNEFIVLNFDENNVEKINNIIKENSLNMLNDYLSNNEENTKIEELINKNKMEITNNTFNYYDFKDLIETIEETIETIEESNFKFGGSNNIDITNTLQDIF